MLDAGKSIADEVDAAIRTGAAEKQLDTTRRITDLFVATAERCDDEQIALFAEVLERLIRTIEIRALADVAAREVLVDMSTRLAAQRQTPSSVIGRLARNDSIDIAQPVLTESRLNDSDLIDIAGTKGEGHLLAIASRWWIKEAVTDALLMRRFPSVSHRLMGNPGARVSSGGFAIILAQAERDAELAVVTGIRTDLPADLRRQLLSSATDAVREKLLTRAPPHLFEEIRNAIAAAADGVGREMARIGDFKEARRLVAALKKTGELNEAKLVEFARARRYAETVTALAALSASTVEVVRPLMQSLRNEGLLVACKVARLQWPAVRAVLDCRFASGSTAEQELAAARAHFETLTSDGARRLLSLWEVRAVAARPAAH